MISTVRNTVVLIGCGKSKLSHSAAAEDLYTGPIFRARRQYAEETGKPWAILSARYGLVTPSRHLDPYDVSLEAMPLVDQRAWAVGVVAQILDDLPDDAHSLYRTCFEIHAGELYADRLYDLLIATGFSASWPVKGLQQGQLLHWYAERRRGRALTI